MTDYRVCVQRWLLLIIITLVTTSFQMPATQQQSTPSLADLPCVRVRVCLQVTGRRSTRTAGGTGSATRGKCCMSMLKMTMKMMMGTNMIPIDLPSHYYSIYLWLSSSWNTPYSIDLCVGEKKPKHLMCSTHHTSVNNEVQSIHLCANIKNLTEPQNT